MQHCGDQDSKYFTRKHPKPLPNLGRLKMTLPDKPQSHNQSILRFKRTHQIIREPGGRSGCTLRPPDFPCAPDEGALYFHANLIHEISTKVKYGHGKQRPSFSRRPSIEKEGNRSKISCRVVPPVGGGDSVLKVRIRVAR